MRYSEAIVRRAHFLLRILSVCRESSLISDYTQSSYLYLWRPRSSRPLFPDLFSRVAR